MSKTQFAAALCLMTIAAFAGGLVGGLAMRPASAAAAEIKGVKVFERLIAKGLCIVDDKGIPRAVIDVSEKQGTVFYMYDAKTRLRMVLAANDTVSRINLRDTKNRTSAVLAVVGVKPHAFMLDDENKTIWQAP